MNRKTLVIVIALAGILAWPLVPAANAQVVTNGGASGTVITSSQCGGPATAAGSTVFALPVSLAHEHDHFLVTEACCNRLSCRVERSDSFPITEEQGVTRRSIDGEAEANNCVTFTPGLVVGDPPNFQCRNDDPTTVGTSPPSAACCWVTGVETTK
jgi:hypothetical protein